MNYSCGIKSVEKLFWSGILPQRSG